MNPRMQVNGLVAEINAPEALKGENLHGLPPHDRCSAYPVDEYPGCPSNWVHGSAKASSYFVPVRAGRGLWFDFTGNAGNSHHVAVVISVQGINPVTGQPVTVLNQEKYVDNCPVHNKPFQQDRFCDECKFKWPAQNYLATTTSQIFWLDGFRTASGEVRQYIITEEELRGVAAQKIGEDRVWAIGFAFYLSKEPKPIIKAPVYKSLSWGSQMKSGCLESFQLCCSKSIGHSGHSGKRTARQRPIRAMMCASQDMACESETLGQDFDMDREELTGGGIEIPATKLEIGAGARIRQDVGVDPNAIDFWQPEPAGIIFVNYVDQKTADKIIKAGRREDKAEGPLDGIKVGN